MTAKRLEGRVALITGATSGIGHATARKFIREGVSGLSIVDHSKDGLNAAETDFRAFAKEINSNVKLVFIHADVSSEEDTQGYYAKHMAAFDDELDLNVQNAGISRGALPWETTPLSHFDDLMAVNARGVWLGVKHGSLAMLKKPCKPTSNPSVPNVDLCPPTKAFVLISSVAALYGHDKLSSYNASKWAVRGLSLTASREFGPRGIRCNSVHPGPVDTPMLRGGGFSNPVALKAAVDPIPLQRVAQPAELANAIAFLCSTEASYINGVALPVHGGQIQG